MMKKNSFLGGGCFAIVLLAGLLVILPFPAEADPGLDEMAQSAYETGDVETAVRYLLSKQVPVSDVVQKGMDSGVSQKQLVDALLSAGLAKQTVALELVLGGSYLGQKTLSALESNGIKPDAILTWLTEKDANIELIVDAAAFMLNRRYTGADVMQTLFEAGADRDVAVKIVQRLNIPPAAVADTRQAAGDAATGDTDDDLSADQTMGYSQWLASVLAGTSTWNNRPISPVTP